MEIELFKVYELNDYGKMIFETDRIFIGQKSNIENFYIVLFPNAKGEILKWNVKEFLIKQAVK
jgi:hypothetical protein